MKKILILYATYGSGHQAVSNYIKDYITNKSSDFEVLTLDILKYAKPIVGPLSKSMGEALVLKTPLLWDIIFKVANHKVISEVSLDTTVKMFETKCLKKMIIDFKPDLIICTHYYASTLIGNMKMNKEIYTKMVSIQTDFAAHEWFLRNYKYEDAIIVPCKEAKKALLEKRPDIKKNKIKNFGIPIYNRFNDEIDNTKLFKKFNVNETKIIATFFGGGIYKTSTVYPYFKRLVKEGFNGTLYFITGNAKDLRVKAQKLVKKYHADNIKVLGYVNNVPEYLMISDYIISKPGGSIINECLYFGRPMVLITKNGGQEKENYKYLVRKRFAVKINNPYLFARYLKNLNSSDIVLNKMKNNVQSY